MLNSQLFVDIVDVVDIVDTQRIKIAIGIAIAIGIDQNAQRSHRNRDERLLVLVAVPQGHIFEYVTHHLPRFAHDYASTVFYCFRGLTGFICLRIMSAIVGIGVLPVALWSDDRRPVIANCAT